MLGTSNVRSAGIASFGASRTRRRILGFSRGTNYAGINARAQSAPAANGFRRAALRARIRAGAKIRGVA
jgi:hypothetical protein